MWEDMSGSQGSLISPQMVRDFMMPNYKKMKAFADENDIPIFSLDTDGDCSELVPLFIECGINLIFPFEVAAGNDIVEYRRKYPMLGMLAKGRDEIDRELERVSGMFGQSGYIPFIDHFFHPEISWENFKYYVCKIKELLGK
jgi:uroporphyrinogen decarboxylase